jgi:hypothetical protein
MSLPSAAGATAGWVRLVEYGEHPHRMGLQVVDRPSAQRMVQNFQSLVRRLARRFRGIPVYIGHPDDDSFRGMIGHGDTRAYGWVNQLDDRSDGLWVLIKWSAAGRDLVDSAYYKFLSPRWEMQSLGGGRFTPRLLVSIGLTNYPNISGEAIANVKFTEFPIAANVEGLGAVLCQRTVLSANVAERAWRRAGSAHGGEKRLLALVEERMLRFREGFTDAWRNVKADQPALFTAPTFANAALPTNLGSGTGPVPSLTTGTL